MVLLSSFRYEQIESQQDTSHLLSQQFNDAVIERYRQSREVSFYARMFHFSPKYFSTLIKQETGVSAGEWIDRYVVLQAKALLQQQRNLTIQQVADRLGFSEQASFSRFFKKQTGLSPTEYRER
jgi:AraC-like DNA-binding protein